MPLIAAALDRMTATIEQAHVLDKPASAAQKITGMLPAGRVKDLLSGTEVGHPLHPALVALPIGAFACTVLLDLTGGDPRSSRRMLGFGLLSALPTIAAGASDWSDTEGGERRVGLVHAAFASTGLALLTRSWWSRRTASSSGVGSALLGVTMIGGAGWLGGHLAYALGVGVDTTAFQRMPTDWTDACDELDLVDGKPVAATVDETPLVLVREGPRVYALADRCSHRGAPLHEGLVNGDCIQCPWHGSRFLLADGAVVRGPATRPQVSLETRVHDGRVQVRVDEPRALRQNPV